MSELRDYSVLNQQHISAADLKAAGAGSTENMLIRGRNVTVNYFGLGHTASNDGIFNQQITPESQAKINGAMQATRYTPQQAMHAVLSQVADPKRFDRAVSPGVREQARDWVRQNGFMMKRKIGNRKILDMHMSRGMKLVGSIKPGIFDKIDPNHELRLALTKKVGPEARKEQKFNRDAIIKRAIQPRVRPMTTRVSSLSQVKDKYALLKAIAPKPATVAAKAAGATMDALGWAVSHAATDASGGPRAKRPTMMPGMGGSRRRLLTHEAA